MMLWDEAEKALKAIYGDRFSSMKLFFARQADRHNRFMVILKATRDSGKTVDVVASGASWEDCVNSAKVREESGR